MILFLLSVMMCVYQHSVCIQCGNICKWIDLLLSVLGLPVQISPVNSFITQTQDLVILLIGFEELS